MKKIVFAGTENPRHERAIKALLASPMPREDLDTAVGCSNAPDIILHLRDKGLEIPCLKVVNVDQDGLESKRGVYTLSLADRAALHEWRSQRRQRSARNPRRKAAKF